MAQHTVKILLEVTVRDFTRAEAKTEQMDYELCKGAANESVADTLAEVIAHHIEQEQDEILAGSETFVRIAAVSASPQ